MTNPVLIVPVAIVVVCGIIVPPTICVLKGKTVLAFASVFVVGLVPATVGAVRLASPDSWGARRYYDPEKLTRAWKRFPDDPLVGRDRDEDLRAAWDGQEINEAELDPITRRALKKAGIL